MSWRAATAVADELGDPIVVIDAAGTIRFVNAAAERCVGPGRVGERLSAVLTGDGLDALVAAGLAGEARRGELVLRRASGAPLALTLRMSLLRDGAERVLVCSFERRAPRWHGSWIEIRTDDPFGKITASQGDHAPAHVGELCHRVFADLDAPCADCPVRQLSVREERTDLQVLPTGRLLQRTVYRSSDTTAQVIHAPLPAHDVARVVLEKLDAIAIRAGLSARERDVLQELITGHTLDDVAIVLGITTRTVRFHQGNVLAKLGITSRLELIQMFLDECTSEDSSSGRSSISRLVAGRR